MARHRSGGAICHSLAGALLAAGLLGLNLPAWSADPERGGELAERWCASCHVINTGGEGRAAERAPSFPKLARDKTKSASYFRGFLTVPHYPKPDLKLGGREIEDLVAYIEAQKKQ
jgi:mono/diheme cytochrome c family protein